MKAYGRHVLIRKVSKPKTTETGIHIPDAIGIEYGYGRVISVGKDVEGVEEGAIAVFDPTGVREIELDPMKDSDVVVVDFSMLFCTMTDQDCIDRKIQLP